MTAHPHLEAWNVSPGHYPEEACTAEQLEFLLQYAILAPSAHNTQPWLFHIDGHRIELYLDSRRHLPVIDPAGRQLMMSCGAALFNLRVAMARFGRRPILELFPSRHDGSLLARVTPGVPIDPSLDLHRMFDAIPRRRTNRKPFEPHPVPYRVACALAAAVRSECAWLEDLHSDDKHIAAELIAGADRTQFHNRKFRRELSKWLVSDGSSRGDGIPGYSKSYGSPFSSGNTLLVRTFDVGGSVASSERELAKGSPMLVVLGTDTDEPGAWLAAGQAMQRMLLVAQSHGVSASFLNQALELDDFRVSFVDLITRGAGYPQLVMRLGYGPEVEATPRRPLGDVLFQSRAHALAASA